MPISGSGSASEVVMLHGVALAATRRASLSEVGRRLPGGLSASVGGPFLVTEESVSVLALNENWAHVSLVAKCWAFELGAANTENDGIVQLFLSCSNHLSGTTSAGNGIPPTSG